MGQIKGNPALDRTPERQAYTDFYGVGGAAYRDGGMKAVMIDDNATLNDVVDVSFATDAVLTAVSASIESRFNNKQHSFISYVGTSATSPSSGSYHKPLGTQVGNITYNSDTGLYTLQANKIYALEASVILSEETDHQSIWRNHTTNTNIGTQTTHVPVNTSNATYSQTTAKAIIATTQSTQVGLTTLVKTGTPIITLPSSYHIIFEI
jgi:hypothetical protein